MARAEFSGAASLDGGVFQGDVDLSSMEVAGCLSCAETDFHERVTLQATTCCGGLWLDQTRFALRPNLRGVEVHGRTWLRGAHVTGGNEAFGQAFGDDLVCSGYRWV
jgi:hypothetical protein